MKRYRLDPKKPRQLTPEEARRLDAMPIDYSDIPPLDDAFFAKAIQIWPPAKQQLTIRLDADVLNWLKASGRGYQTRINRILRAAMESRPRPTATPKKNNFSATNSSRSLPSLASEKFGNEKAGVRTAEQRTRSRRYRVRSSGNVTDAHAACPALAACESVRLSESRAKPASARTEAGHSFRTRCRTASAIHWL